MKNFKEFTSFIEGKSRGYIPSSEYDAIKKLRKKLDKDRRQHAADASSSSKRKK